MTIPVRDPRRVDHRQLYQPHSYPQERCAFFPRCKAFFGFAQTCDSLHNHSTHLLATRSFQWG